MKTWTTFEGDVALIVDDVPENLSLLSDALSEAGYTVLVATDGLSALARLEMVVPDIILLDAVMPGIDGFETCRRIKQLEQARHVPVIFMTGLTESEHVLKGFEAGGLDYVTKPIKPVEVLARMATHIKTARMMAQASHAIDAVSHAAISLSTDGTLLWQTRQAAEWMEKYFPGAQADRSIPAALEQWLIEAKKPGANVEAFQMSLGEYRLFISTSSILSTNSSGNLSTSDISQETVLLLEEKRIPAESASLAQFKLTPREREVLSWLAKGKTNRDIGDILGMSPRTVNKHLEHVFVKFGVETRSAAVSLWAGLAD